MSMTTPLLALPLIQPAQAQKHVTHNEALRLLDAVAQLAVRAFDALTPPAAAAGDVWALGPAPEGDWAGQGGRLALWDGTGWIFIAPREGWRAWDAAGGELRVHEAGAWRPLGPSFEDVAGLGVNTRSDATNRLAVAAPATLLSHDGAGHQVKVNKAAAGDTASLLFQSGWAGHAELGLAGGLDFSLKVSGGAEWRDALRVARATGRVTLPQGAVVDGPLTGAAVQAGATDATPGRLLTAGAFGLGGLLPPVGDCGATDGSLVPGLYAYDAGAGSTGGPSAVARGSLLHTRRAPGAGETQVLVVEAAGGPGAAPGAVLSRARAGGAWSPWLCGSVAESGAGPTGRWVRHQDGTQTCWHTLTTSTSADAVWTFPAPFASTAGLALTMGVVSTSVAVLCPRASARTATTASFAIINSTPARVSATLDVCATGRWH